MGRGNWTQTRPPLLVAVALVTAAAAGALWASGLADWMPLPFQGTEPAVVRSSVAKPTVSGTAKIAAGKASVSKTGNAVAGSAPAGSHGSKASPAARAAKTGRASANASTMAASSIDLCAKAGSATMPDGESVDIWGFALKSGTGCDDAGVVAQLPGPELDVNQGDDVTLNVTNTLDRPISIEVPGIDFDPGPTDVAAGATVALSFHAGSEGTYLYDSAGDAGRQAAMGLYGAMVVHSSSANQAYGNAFDLERVLVLSEIDPELNSGPDAFVMNNWSPKYWLINGKAYPDTPMIDVASGQKLLLRYLNAGSDNNTVTMLGLRQRVLARDAYALADPFDVVTQTFPSGETSDALITIPVGAAAGSKFPVYNRNLQLANGSPGASNHSPGGMMTFIHVP